MDRLVSDRLLFVPASGPRGSGEVYRCLNLARALLARRPALDLHVVLDRSARSGDASAPDAPWTTHELDATPARAGVAVETLLGQLAPAVAVFDGSGRTAHLRKVRQQGGRVVWVANRPSRRRRGFSPRRLRWVDLHVLVGPGRGAAPPGRLERGLMRWFGTSDAFSAQAVAPEAVDLPAGLEIDPDRAPALFVSGGGGQVVDGQPVPELFLAAARRFHAATGCPSWVVLGPRYAGPVKASDADDPAGVRVFSSLPTDQLGAVLRSAHLVVAGAGNMLSNQVLLARRPCVMVAVGGHDQPERLERYVDAGAVRSSALSDEAMADAAIELFEQPGAASSLVEGIDRLGVVNDTGRIADRLLTLFP